MFGNAITNDDLLEAMMATLMRPSAVPTGDGMSYALPSPIGQIANTLVSKMNQDPEFQKLVVDEIVARLPEAMPALMEKLIGSIVYTRGNGSSYDPKVRMIADWAKEPLQEALRRAVQDSAEAYVQENMGFPLTESDRVVVNISIEKNAKP